MIDICYHGNDVMGTVLIDDVALTEIGASVEVVQMKLIKALLDELAQHDQLPTVAQDECSHVWRVPSEEQREMSYKRVCSECGLLSSIS